MARKSIVQQKLDENIGKYIADFERNMLEKIGVELDKIQQAGREVKQAYDLLDQTKNEFRNFQQFNQIQVWKKAGYMLLGSLIGSAVTLALASWLFV